MKAMQSRHGIIKAIEEDFPLITLQETRGVRKNSMMDLSDPLKIFVHEE
jgi:hypothetical protein